MTKGLKITDALAIDRTKLANERTFLAYFRTFVVLASSGIAITQIHILDEVKTMGYFLLFLAPFLLLIGTIRYAKVKRYLSQYKTTKL